MTTATATRWSIPGAKVIMTAKDVAEDRSKWLQLRTTGVTATDLRVLNGHG
jgi:CelD/BcsL family acetyltransferase involved in cellulose biosynthesis